MLIKAIGTQDMKHVTQNPVTSEKAGILVGVTDVF
jgi:hypothetical protein